MTSDATKNIKKTIRGVVFLFFTLPFICPVFMKVNACILLSNNPYTCMSIRCIV